MENYPVVDGLPMVDLSIMAIFIHFPCFFCDDQVLINWSLATQKTVLTRHRSESWIQRFAKDRHEKQRRDGREMKRIVTTFRIHFVVKPLWNDWTIEILLLQTSDDAMCDVFIPAVMQWCFMERTQEISSTFVMQCSTPQWESLRYGDFKLISTYSTPGKLPISKVSGLLQEFNEGIEGQLSIFANFGQNTIHEACLKQVIHWQPVRLDVQRAPIRMAFSDQMLGLVLVHDVHAVQNTLDCISL